MNQFKRHRELLVALTGKDWSEYGKAVAIITVFLAIPVIVKLRGKGRPDFVQGLIYSFVLCAAWIYAQSCFVNERIRGTLERLLSLPLDPFELVVAKHLSIYTMVLVTINVPMVLLRDWHLLLLANAGALLLSTLILTSTVIWAHPFAAQIPVFVLIGTTFLTEDNLQAYYPPGLFALHWAMTHTTLLAVVAICVSPVIAVFAATIFKRCQPR